LLVVLHLKLAEAVAQCLGDHLLAGSQTYREVTHFKLGQNVVGDLADHGGAVGFQFRLDAQVYRTANRPIPSGQVSPEAALVFVAATACVGLAVVLNFNWFTIWLAISSLLVVAAYPFAKRLIPYPQLVLGFAFSWGALVGWAAVKGSLGLPALVLFTGCVLWTIGYDTIYAHQDKEDDALLGLGSTALKFGGNTVSFVGALYGLAAIFWLIAGALAGAHLVYFLAVALVFLQMSWQVATLDIHDSANCLRRFQSNRDVGLAVFLGLLADKALSWFAGLG